MSILSILLLVTFALGSRAAVYIERQPSIPGHENQCYDKDANIFYNRGEVMGNDGKECLRKICAPSFGKGPSYVEIQTCGKISAPPECHVKTDPTQPYPKCCGWIVCPKFFNYSFEAENEIE